MSSNNTTKKRKVDSDEVDESGISLAAVLAEMQEMKSKLSRMGEMQNELNGMKSGLSRMDYMQITIDNQQSHIDSLERKCNILEDKCNSLQRSVEILSKESKWEYSAPSIPGSHWTGLGFNEEYIEYMDELVNNIRNASTRMRKGECTEDIDLGEESLGGVAGTILQHDKVLLPHWKEFTTALQLSHGIDLNLTIQNVQLTISVTDLLIPAVKGKLKSLFLDNNDLFQVGNYWGILFVVKCIEINRPMKELYLANNQIGNMSYAATLLEAIISHPSIEYVRLENCFDGGEINGYNILRTLLASDKRFKVIDFDRNNIQTNGDTAIPNYIASNPQLRTLRLSWNKLNDNDARLIAMALKQNTNLIYLHLNDNDMTDSGYRALSKAVYDPTSLNTVYDCNHTCQIEVDGDRISEDIPLSCNNAGSGYTNPKTKRSTKIHYILSLRHKEGSNVQHLNTEFDEDKDGDNDTSLTLKIVPKVFEAVYNHSNAPRPTSVDHTLGHSMSITYEILRGWKMPELHDTRSRR